MPAESEGVGQGGPDSLLSGDVGHIVEIAVRVRVVQIDGGWYYTVLDCQDAYYGFNGAGCPDQVSHHGLGGANGDLLFALGPLVWGQDTIKIGVVGPRTGPAAATGKAFEEGIAIALDHINAKGGVMGKKVEVIFEDTGGVPEKAASALERLATREKVPVVVGESHSSSALAEIEVANRYKIPLII